MLKIKRDKASRDALGATSFTFILVLALLCLPVLLKVIPSASQLAGMVDCQSVADQPSVQKLPSEVQSALDPGDLVPVSCRDVLKERKTSKETFVDPNTDQNYARYTKTDPPFFISLHTKSFDPTRWAIWDHGIYYEKVLTEAFVEVLRKTENHTRVIDVGGNIGYFSLLSAAAKESITIDTFEPNPKNRLRYCESLGINHWTFTEFDNGALQNVPQMNLYDMGVGSEPGSFTFLENRVNPGQGMLGGKNTNGGEQVTVGKTITYAIRVITLDELARQRGWFESPVDIAVLKVDVEGLEYKVIEGAKELLKTKMIRHIFTEVSARNEQEGLTNIPFIEYLVSVGYKLYKEGGWQGPNRAVNWPHDDTLAAKILEATNRERAKQLNLWWTVDPEYLAPE